MAKKVSENNIQSINNDWALDPSNNLPYSGAAVQKFIKDTLNSKMGYFHYDVASNRYLCFADSESKDKYLANPTMTELILGSFDAPFNYEAVITMSSPQYNAVFYGSTGNYIDFTFDIKNKEGGSTGENVTVTYTFIRNATKKVITETRRYGESVHFNVDDYILEGNNTIIIGIIGQTTLAATTVAITYQVVNLSFEDDLNIAKIYDFSKNNKTVEVYYKVNGYGTKIVEWYLDGALIPFSKSEDEILDVQSERTKYIDLSRLATGIHTLQSRVYTLINGEKFYTDILYRELIVINGSNNANMVAIATTLPNSHGIVTETNPVIYYGVEQYIPYELRFATRKNGNVSIHLNDQLVGTVNSVSGVENYYNVTSNKAGSFPIKFVIDNITREVNASVATTPLDIEEITNALTFDFRAIGKSNNSIDKDSWSYENYTGTFNGFNWNASSGWVNNSLLINNGASFSIDFAPLAVDATQAGKTLEIEFYTTNVENDDAVVCDLTTNGVGLLITASEARLTSAAGEVVSTRFKAGEINRIAFVINKKSGTTYKGLAFVYVNGILSGAVNYGSADKFTSTKQISFVGTEDAQIALRAMRVYDAALSADNILNNYILYRDTLTEMMEVYYRNEIYEEGTQNFSPEQMLHRLPVMIITGDIPVLEAATSTSTQILVDIDYTNEQDPTKNFKMTNAALRIQGTSSLAYPRKNFRFYTQVEESTQVYDHEGNKLRDKLYQFVDGAQPVNCWCLKADFAESSGTHNTGIAKIWNKAMYGAMIQFKNVLGEEVNGYALRTEAQNKALAAGFDYDVRTTIDGFPIVLFYKKNASDTNLIFLGKYNFNNDKSTPSVFGFEGIPGFDNSRMQCWETKDNGHPLGLFTDVSEFDANWSEAFESRYPDTKTPNTSDLKAFSLWINSVSQENFVTEKWAHLDVYKVAAYYCYLMRFGAVDQPVKNGFLTSEDGQKFYYINYDNDTINGLINTGRLALDPTINRDTIGSDGEYVYAGHDSVLWQRCTSDTEFMEIVSVVDNALYSAGLRYDEVIKVFNEDQAEKWVERVYNQDAEYKYVLPYVNQATNNLFMLQGSRSSHRSWWLSKRFSLYDSIFLSGAYRDRNISFKCLNDTDPGQQFTIKVDADMNYGYGVNNGIRETGIALEKGDEYTFTTTDTLNLGDVVKVFASSNLHTLDLSEMADRIAVLDCSAAADPALGTKMKRLILGGDTYVDPDNGIWMPTLKVNTELAAISGINVLTSLQELNIQGYENITTLDLTAQKDFRKLYASGSNLASVDFEQGTPVDYLELPASIMALRFNQLPYLTKDNVIVGTALSNNYSNIYEVSIYGCPQLTNDLTFINKWLSEKTTADADCILNMDGIDWEMSYDEFLAFSQYKLNGMVMDLRGKVYLTSLTLDQANEIMNIWGDNCFDKNADFRITAPDALYINPDNVTLNEGESVQFSYILFSSSEGTVEYRIVSGSREGVSIDASTGVLTTIENGAANATLYVRAIYRSQEGNVTYATATVNVKKRIYPISDSITITGESTISKDELYKWTTSAADVNGAMIAEWTLSGDAVDGGYVQLGAQTLNTCNIVFNKAAEKGVTINGTITVNIKKAIDGTVMATKSKTFTMAKLNYPEASNTTVTGDAQPESNNPVYTWESTAQGTIGPLHVIWTLDESLLPFYEIQSQEWDESDPLHGSCTLVKIMDVEFYMKGNINVTITRINTGESFTVSHQLMILSPDVIMTEDTNKPVLDALYGAGLCANSTYMTKAEAEAVQDGSFNPTNTQSGSIFYNNTSIKSFDEFEYFTGMTTLDAYAFYGCTKMTSLKIPTTIVNYEKYCCYRNDYGYEPLTIDSINVQNLELSREFHAYSKSLNGRGSIKINNVNWYYNVDLSSSRTVKYSFYNAFIEKMNVYNIGKGTDYGGGILYHTFGNTEINNLYISDQLTTIPSNAFDCAYIHNAYIPDSITIIEDGAFDQFYEYCNIHTIGNNITKINKSSFTKVRFKTDIDFSKITNINDQIYVSLSIYDGELKVPDTTKTFYFSQFLTNTSCAKFQLPCSASKYDIDYNMEIENLYVPDLVKYCKIPYAGNSTYYGVLRYAQNAYFNDVNTGEYVQLVNFDPNYWLISSIGSYAFRGFKGMHEYDGRSIKDHTDYVFYESSIKTLKLDNFNGGGTIADNAFGSCKLLELIDDASTQPWATLHKSAFKGVNETVKINSRVFGLYKQSTGFTIGQMFGDTVYSFAFGDYTFDAPTGTAFSDKSTSKTLTLGYTGAIEDLTEKLKIEYLTLVVNSNIDDAQFEISYIDTNNNSQIEIVSVGSHMLNISKNSQVSIVPKDHQGYLTPESTTVVMNNATNIVTINYYEDVDIYIADINGVLYTEEEWLSSGNDNDIVEGICVYRAHTGGFIINKTHGINVSKWGSESIEIANIMTTDNAETAKSDFNGYHNTLEIIKQDSSALAAITASSYTFPSGAKGYLPAMGELYLMVKHRNEIENLLTVIDGVGLGGGSYTSSTQRNSTYCWEYHMYQGSRLSTKSRSSSGYDVRPVAPYGGIILNSNIKTTFNISYTNKYDELTNIQTTNDYVSLSIKLGTSVTVTPQNIGVLTAEPQTFTWTGFSHECNFVFAKDAGVYIQHVDGLLYTESEWTTGGYANTDANGIAVLSSDVAFVIAKEDASTSKLSWGLRGIAVPNVYDADFDAALYDFYGYNNTENIVKYAVNNNATAPAAEACVNYTFPNGKKGYLPAFGEFSFAQINRTSIDTMMTLIGATAFKTGIDDYYSTSTQFATLSKVVIKWTANTVATNDRDGTQFVRAFTTL